MLPRNYKKRDKQFNTLSQECPQGTIHCAPPPSHLPLPHKFRKLVKTKHIDKHKMVADPGRKSKLIGLQIRPSTILCCKDYDL